MTGHDLIDAVLPDILIVDDDPGMVQVLAKALRPLGRLRFAMHGQDALERIASAVPDIVLLDAQMPGLSGFDVLDAIKANPALADLPVIMVTSHAEADFEQAGLERGAADFIAKPIHPPVVQARVRTQLRLKQANDQLKQMSAADRQNLAVAREDLSDSHARLQRTADELRLANESLVQFVRIGFSNKEIAARLDKSVRTVKTQLTSVYKKCGVRSRTRLLAMMMPRLSYD